MAAVTSGQVNTNTTYDSYFWVKWSQKGNQSIENNQTEINWSCGVYCGHSFYSNAIKMSPVSIDGTQIYGGGTYSNYSKGNHTIASGTLKITHGSDGKKSFSISAFTGWLYSNNNYSASEKSFELTQIPRISVPTLSVKTQEFGKSVTIYTNRKATSFTHKLFYKYGTSEWFLITDTASVTTEYAWTIPKSLMSSIPNSLNLDITISCDTYYNGAYIGEEHVVVTAKVPDTAECYPSMTNIVWTKNSTEPDSWGMTQNVSKGTMAMTGVSGAYGSTIKSYSLTFAGLSSTASSLTVPNIASSGTLKAVAKITDSRGRSFEKSVDFTVSAYEKPKLTVEVYRSDAAGEEDTTGEYLYVKATVSTTVIGNNSLGTLTIKLKRHSASAYGTPVTLTPGVALTLPASSDYTWDWVVTATDKVSTVSINGSISTGEVVLDILANGRGIGLGKVAEHEGLDSAWAFRENGEDPMMDYPISIGTSGIWTYRKWKSGIAECWGLFHAEDVDISNAWGYMYESKTGYSVNFPSGLFVSAPCLTLNTQAATPYSVMSLEVNDTATKDRTCSFYPIRPTPGVVNYLTVAITAVGKWK